MLEIFDIDAKAVIARAPFEWMADSGTDAIIVGDLAYLVTGYIGRRIQVRRLTGELPEAVTSLWSLPTTRNGAAKPKFRNEAGDFTSPPDIERKNARKSWKPSKPPVIESEPEPDCMES